MVSTEEAQELTPPSGLQIPRNIQTGRKMLIMPYAWDQVKFQLVSEVKLYGHQRASALTNWLCKMMETLLLSAIISQHGKWDLAQKDHSKIDLVQLNNLKLNDLYYK